MHPPESQFLRKREDSRNECSQGKNKGSERLLGNTKHFALGFLVKRTSTSPNRKPAAPESHPMWCHQQIELVLSSGLVMVQSKGAHTRHDWKEMSPLLWRSYFVPLRGQQNWVFPEMPRIVELAVCWQLVGRISALEGVKYARVFIVHKYSERLQSIQCVKKLAQGEGSVWSAQSTLCSI